jgi:hypothetical protein
MSQVLIALMPIVLGMLANRGSRGSALAFREPSAARCCRSAIQG